MSSYFRQQLEDWVGGIIVSPASNVGDVGGSQLPVKGRLASAGEGSTYVIIDRENRGEEPDVKFNIETGVGVTVLPNGHGVAFSTYHGEPFDVIFCLEVMEYLTDPLSALRNMKKMLRDGGRLYISFPFIYPLHPPHETDYLRYTRYGAKKLLDRAGWEIEDYQSRTFNNAQGWHNLFASEKWRHDKEESAEALNETGCLITARKK